MNLSDETLNVNQLQLSLLRVNKSVEVSPAVMRQSTLTIERLWHDITENLIVTLNTHVLADQLVDEEVVIPVRHYEYESWWQHTKAVHFPTFSRWLKSPPRMRQVVLDVTVHPRQWMTFPEADLYPVELDKPVEVQQFSWRRNDG